MDKQQMQEAMAADVKKAWGIVKGEVEDSFNATPHSTEKSRDVLTAMAVLERFFEVVRLSVVTEGGEENNG